jgi:molybdopterin-guanine dinucleotide biosynthesis protein A
MTSGSEWDAVVVAGGSARRMGGADKLMLDVGGRPVLERVLRACRDAQRVVVVGRERAVAVDVQWCQEDPPGGGPAAAIAAGVAHVTAPVTVLLAGDLPLLDPPSVRRLVGAVDAHRGAVAVDGDANAQWLCSAWPTAVLRATSLGAEMSLRHTLGALRWNAVTLDDSRTVDCDTPDDLTRARELAT